MTLNQGTREQNRLRKKLESYPHGYPRLTAFLSLDRSFTILKRFDDLHIRALLDYQDRLCELEQCLEGCDNLEDVSLNLNSRRQDGNLRRRELIEEVKKQLNLYDKAVLDYHNILRVPQAEKQHRESLRNWVDGTKPLVRSESSCFFDESDDFMVFQPEDHDKGLVEFTLEWILRTWPHSYVMSKIVSSENHTADRNILLIEPETLNKIAKYTVAIIISLWLVTPAILLLYISDHGVKTILYFVFTLGMSLMVPSLTKTTKYNLIMVIIAYGAILAAFLSTLSDTRS